MRIWDLEAREHLRLALALRRLHLAADLDGLVQRHVDGLRPEHLPVHGRHLVEGLGFRVWV